MIIIDTFAQFLAHSAVYARTEAPANWRTGQSVFNLLCKVRPDLAEMVRGSDNDPFHDDSRLGDFYSFLMFHWNPEADNPI